MQIFRKTNSAIKKIKLDARRFNFEYMLPEVSDEIKRNHITRINGIIYIVDEFNLLK